MAQHVRARAAAILAACVMAVALVLGVASPASAATPGHVPSSAARSRSPEHAVPAATTERLVLVVLLARSVPGRGTEDELCGVVLASGRADAGGDPVNETDPTGDMSLGFCAGFAIHVLLIQLGADDCLVGIITGPDSGQIAITGTAEGAVGLGLAAGLQWTIQVTNADTLNELSSWFTYFNATAALGDGVTGTFFWNNHWSGRIIVGGNVGDEIGAGASGAIGESYSWVHPITGWFDWLQHAADGVFSYLKSHLLSRPFLPQMVLNDATTVAHQQTSCGS